MDEAGWLTGMLAVHAAVAVITAVVLTRVSAPYGRHARAGWGPTLPFSVGWALMEGISPVVMVALFLAGDRQDDPAAWCFLGAWLLHYVHRAFIQAWQRRGRATPIPALVVGLAVLFNLVNAGTNGRWLFAAGPAYGAAWLTDPRFGIGAALFLGGMAVNRWADAALLRLRKPGETGYKVPHGGLYEVVSCPNYLGEVVEWTGFAIMTWSPPGLVFALWTAANLVPRAVTHHAWYQATFPDYPARRRAIFPGLL